jgi:hypothetical protein
VVHHEPSADSRSDDDADQVPESTSGEQGYEGAGVEEGGGYQRSEEGGGYEQSGTEDEDYDPRREGGG